jgi:hypothetical protein
VMARMARLMVDRRRSVAAPSEQGRRSF